VCVCNFARVVRPATRVGLPVAGRYVEVLNTDAAIYGGSGASNGGAVVAELVPHHGPPFSAELVLPLLGVLWLRVPDGPLAGLHP